MKILTYYTPLNYRPPEDDYRLLLLWRQNWIHWGFEPVVLGEWWARKHPAYEKFNAIVSQFPTINPPEYDRACLLRWLAYAQAGGGIACDYDLFCYRSQAPITEDKRTRAARASMSVLSEPLHDTLQMLQLHVPSLVMGTRKAYESVIEGIMRYQVDVKDVNEFGKPHVSDMHIFLKGTVPRNERHLVRNYLEQGWLDFPFTHFSSGSMQVARKLPKWKHIPTLRDYE